MKEIKKENIKINREVPSYNLLAKIIIFLLMLILLFFFNLFNANDNISKLSGILVILFLFYLFFKIIQTGEISKYRRILFIFSAATFFPTFIAMLIEERGTMFLSYKEIFLNETPFCHIVIPMVILPYFLEKILIFPARLTGHFAAFYAMVVIFILSCLTVGRGFCSWVCFYGGWDECSSRIFKRKFINIPEKFKNIRYLNFAFLLAIILTSLASFSPSYCTWFCPWKLITEYEQLVNFSTMFSFIFTVLIFFTTVIIFPILTKKRTHCMSFCPYGALASLLDKLSLFRVRVNFDKCVKCLRCANVCPVMAIDEQKIKYEKNPILTTCLKCGECIDKCQVRALEYVSFYHNDFEKKINSKNTRDNNYSEGTLKKIDKKISKINVYLKNTFLQIFSAHTLMIFSGFLIGSIILGGFAQGTIYRLINLLLKGSFLLK
ncbi:MAG: 4Fe-4S binding protein [Spirochaetes bacterium]|nr:4Fe-4S binding protein [Spirochaetota bacterium]